MTGARMPYEVPRAWRVCVYPGCEAHFDALNYGAPGPWRPPGWVHGMFPGRDLCPDHATGLHPPHKDGRRAVCGCGWRSPEVRRLPELVAAWRDHVVDAEAAGRTSEIWRG